MSRKQLQPARKRGRPSNVELAARREAEALLASLPVSTPAPEATGAAAPSTVAQAAGVDATVDRENPRNLRGKDLHDFANRRGMSYSEMAGWSDDRVREQLNLLLCRQYERRDEAHDFLIG